jgi:thymidine kinase
MFSGKSLRLLERIEAARRVGRRVAVFKHVSDDRYHEVQIVTHNGRRTDATPIREAGEMVSLVGDAEIVVVDEAQFFTDDLIGVCRRLAKQGCKVLVAGLDRDSWGFPFGAIPDLTAVADEVMFTTATCSVCGKEAMFTQRLGEIEGQRMIGGPESYEPRCADCFSPPPIELRR